MEIEFWRRNFQYLLIISNMAGFGEKNLKTDLEKP